MTGAQQIKQFRAVGFTDDEVAQWAVGKRQTLTAAGFSKEEIDTNFGFPPFNPKPVQQAVEAQHEKTSPGLTPVTDFAGAFEAGFGMSTAGLLAKPPTKVVSPEASRASRIASYVGTLLGDIPSLTAGYIIGGLNPITGTAGAMGLTAGMRRVMMDKYENGEVTGWADFWDRTSGAVIDTLKGWVTGAATGAAGKTIGALPILSPTVKAAATVTGEVATMTTIGAALDGHMPEPDDFLDTALTLGAVKGAGRIAGKLRDIYATTGVKPADVAADVMKDPTILHDVMAANRETPRTYQPQAGQATVESIHATAEAKGFKWDNFPAFMNFTEQLTGKRHLDALTPAERAEVSTALEEWTPSTAMAGGAPNKAVGPAQQAILNRLVLKDPETERMTLSGIYTSLVDNLNPIKQALKAADKTDLATAINPYSLERLTRGIAGKASEFLNAGAFDFNTYKTKTPGYFTILESVKNDLDGFRAYMVAKRAIEKAEQGFETGVPIEDAKFVVREGRTTYEATHQARLAYRSALLDTLQQSGILSAKSVDAMREANKDYVPFYRLLEDETGQPTSARRVRNPIKRLKGSERQILDPIISDIKDTFLFVALAEKNAARQAFVALGSEVAEKQAQPLHVTRLTEPEIEKLFKEFVTVTKETKRTQTEKTQTTSTGGVAGQEPPGKALQLVTERVKEALRARGFSTGETDQMVTRIAAGGKGADYTTVETVIREIERTVYMPELDIRLPHEVATIFRAMQAPTKADEIAVYTKGHRDVYAVDPAVAEAFNGLDAGPTHLLAKIVFAPARLLRAGVTITPDFIFRNILRDAVSAFIYAGSNPIKTAKGLYSIATQDTAYHNWLKGGGAQATMVAIDRDYLSQHLGQLNQDTGLLRRAWNVVRTPLDLLRAASELVENATRVGAVRSELLQATSKAQIQALVLIAREATVDFGRHGKDTQGFARATAFFNPTVQGIDRFAREAKNNPLGMTVKAIAAVTLPSMLLWYANRDDKEIQDLPRWQHDLFWLVRTPLPEGNSFIMRIPKPQEFGVLFGSLPERLLDKFVADNPAALKDIEGTIINAFSPSLVPTTALPVVAQFANRDVFLGRPLIPAGQENLLPEYQYTPYTTELAKALGQLIGAFPGMERAAVRNEDLLIGGTARALTTPTLLENYLHDWTGGMGGYLLQLADKALREAGVLPDPVRPTDTLADIPFIKAFTVRYPAATAQSVQDFYTEYASSKRYTATLDYLIKEGHPKAEAFMGDHAGDLAQLDSIQSTLSDTSRLIRLIAKNPEFSSDEQRQLIDTLAWRMIELAKAGNDGLRKMRSAMEEAITQPSVPALQAPVPIPQSSRLSLPKPQQATPTSPTLSQE